MTTEQKNLARLGVLGFAILLASGAFGTRELFFPSAPEIKVALVTPLAQPTRAPASASPAVALTQVKDSPLLPRHQHTEHRDHDDCYKSMQEAAKASPELIAPLTQEEILAGLFTNPKIEALYNEFQEVITLPDGSKALRTDVSKQFEQSLEQLDNSAPAAPSVDL
jgi:hypothetical protein